MRFSAPVKGGKLRQRVDSARLSQIGRPLKGPAELLLVECGPFDHQAKRPCRELALNHRQRININLRGLPAITRENAEADGRQNTSV